MTEPMTELERVLVVAVQYAKRCDDANPDVGMGPAPAMLLDDVLREALVTTLDDRGKARVLRVLERGHASRFS